MIKPLRTNILLKKVEKSNKTSSGIILSTKEEKQENVGKVIACGSEVKDIPIGSKVIFEQYKGTSFTNEQDEEFLILDAKEILAIIE